MKTLKSTKLIALLISAVLLIATIAGISASAEEGTPSLEIFSKNLSYGGTISIAFAVDAENIDSKDVELLVYTSEPTEDSEAAHVVKTSEVSTVHEREALVFLTPGIASKDMTKQIYVKAHAVVDGKDVYSETERYSVAEYAYDMQYRSKINENFIKLGAALLEVGEQIQTLLPHNVDNSPLDFYYVCAEEGTVDGKYSAGLFKKGEDVTLNYTGVTPAGKTAYWTYGDVRVSNGATIKASAHAVYEVAFEDSYDTYVPGAFYNDKSKEGTRYADATAIDGAGKTAGIANNALGTFKVGTTYVVETDFTFNGGKPATSDVNAAFFGLQMSDELHNDNMFMWAYVKYLDSEGNAVSYLGAELLKGVTYNLRFEYTVGDGNYPTGSSAANTATRADYLASCLKFFVNGVEIKQDLSQYLYMGNDAYAATASDRSFWGIALKTRSASYNSSDISFTLDNTFIAPKAALPDGQIESYYENTFIDGSRYSFDEGTDGVAIYDAHGNNAGQYGSLVNLDGALNLTRGPRWYGFAFLNSDYTASKAYAEGTQFVFEADITLNSYTGVTETSPAFLGFFGEQNTTLTNNQMYTAGIYTGYDFTANTISIFGAKVGTGKTVKVTLVYTVGGSTVDVYADGSFVCTSNCGSGTNFYGFGFYVRGGAGTNDTTLGLNMTFDNVFVGVIEAK